MTKEEYEAKHGVEILNWAEIPMKTKGIDTGSPVAGSTIKIRCKDCGGVSEKVLTPKVLGNGHYGRCKTCATAIGSEKVASKQRGQKHSPESLQRIRDGWARRGGDQVARQTAMEAVEAVTGPILNWSSVTWTASDRLAWKTDLQFTCSRCQQVCLVGYRGEDRLSSLCSGCRIAVGKGGVTVLPPPKPPRIKQPLRVTKHPGHALHKSQEWRELQSNIQQEKKKIRPTIAEMEAFEKAFGTKVTNWNSITVIARTNNHGWPRYRETIEFTCQTCGRPGSKMMTEGILASESRTKCRSCVCMETMQKQGGRSKAEVDVEDYIKSLGILVQPSVIGLVPGYEVDIYVPDKRVGFEYCGLYWHDEQKRGQTYHIEKLEAAEKAGIRLVQIFEDEWINNQTVVKSKIRSILGGFGKRVFARSCTVTKPTDVAINAFLEANHIQGSGAYSEGYGLEHDDTLVAVMTFVKSRALIGAVVEGEYELMRFATSCQVVGGASRLLTAFRREFPKAPILSYADRRWSRGGVYEALGFKLDHKTQPNYWYIQGLERLHRANFTKGALVVAGFDASKTEKEIMEERGISRIYDCGSLVYRLDPQTT